MTQNSTKSGFSLKADLCLKNDSEQKEIMTKMTKNDKKWQNDKMIKLQNDKKL